IPLPHRVKSPPEQYAVSVRFGIAEGPAVFRVLLRSAPPVGVSWRMAYTMETSRTTIACLLVEYSSNWQNNMATNCPQLLKPRACRSALCLRAAVSNPVREMSCKICEKMLHTLFKAESSSDWLVFANSTYQRLSAFFFPKAIRSAELIWTRLVHGIKPLPPPPPRDRGRLPKRQTNYFEKGFCRKYALQDIHYEFFLAEGSSVDSYRKACQRALEKLVAGQKWDLAIVQIEEPFHQLTAQCNPYFVSKVSFHTHQIPVQEFEIETTRRPDKELIYVLNNMGLAIYAKLNGIPWLLKANPTIAHELVIGLGSATVGEGRLGQQERFVGITTLFSGDGNYHLSNLSKAVSMDEYETALLGSLRAAILKVRTDMNWQPKDQVRLVFHATFKRFSRKEVQSIKGLLSELGDYDVEYAFVQLSEQHPYILFDKKQSGAFDYETKRIKGIYAPERGRYLELGNRGVLLSLTGPREVKRPEDGTPRPLFLSLHRDSTFTDMTYLTRQVFRFACHSWRTFLPASVPVTIQYSNLIANALGHLSLMDRWNPEVMLGRIGTTRWFL